MSEPTEQREQTSAETLPSSIAELRAQIAGGKRKASDAVRACLAQIAAHNNELKAFIRVLGCEALAEAEGLDSQNEDASLPGVPIAVKDLIDVRGTATTAASRVLESAPPADSDAECIRRLRRAGAVVIGKSNLHEFAYGGSGVVSAFGAVRNPRDRRRVCGGSSSGSAAAVAAQMACAALGTDTAGSIRLPAACCGVVGFKPSWDAVPVAGVIPLAWSYDHLGPLARSVEDAAAVFAVLADQQPQWSERKATSGAIRCGVLRSYFGEGLAPEVADGFERAVAAARSLGWSVAAAEIEVSEDRRASNAESWAYHHKWATAQPELYDPRTLPRIVNGKKVAVEEYIEARRALELLRERNRAGAAGFDLLLSPTSPILPPLLDEFDTPAARNLELVMLRNTRPFNVLGWPAISVPCAPMVGVQISAAWGEDWPLLSAARALESALR